MDILSKHWLTASLGVFQAILEHKSLHTWLWEDPVSGKRPHVTHKIVIEGAQS